MKDEIPVAELKRSESVNVDREEELTLGMRLINTKVGQIGQNMEADEFGPSKDCGFSREGSCRDCKEVMIEGRVQICSVFA